MKIGLYYERTFFKKIFFLLLNTLMIFHIVSCGLKEPLPEVTTLSCEKIQVVDGPEDFVLDKWSSPSRLLISSYERREQNKPGDVFSFDLKTKQLKPLKRNGEERERLKSFKPHGMDILHKDDETFLYIILHDPYGNSKEDENAIGIYKVLGDEMVFVDLLEDKDYLWSPNDLSVLENGEIYVTNDVHSDIEAIFRINSSEVVYYNNKDRIWSLVAYDLAYANGILAQLDRVFVTTTRGNKLIEFPRKSHGALGEGKTIAKLKGLDNIMPYKDKLLIPAHYDDIAFLKHSKNRESISPSVVFRINPGGNSKSTEIEPIYVNKGDKISAVSTAFIHDDKLYLGQVYNDYILICDLDKM